MLTKEDDDAWVGRVMTEDEDAANKHGSGMK